MDITSSKKFTLPGRQDSLQRLLVYFALFLAIGLVLFFVAQNIAYSGFDTMDDIQIQNLLNGSKGVSEGFCNHMNVFLGSFLAFLYRALPSLNWYGVFLLTMLLVSCALTAAAIAQRLGGKTGFALGFTVFPFICMDAMYGFTYTVISYVMLACVFACIACAFFLKDKRTRLFLWICAAVLCVLSVMLRTDVIVSAAGVGALYALFLLIRYKKAAAKTAAILAAILVLSFGFTCVSNLLFATDPVWNEYYKFNETRIDMQDRFFPAYSQNQADYQEYGWTENDYNLFYSANIPDDPKFSAENLERIDATYKAIDRYDWNISEIASSLWDYISHSVPFLILLSAAFILALISSRSKLLAVMVFLFPFLMQIALVVIQRPLSRVVVPHYYIALVLLLCLINASALRERFGGKTAKPLAVLMLILALGVSIYPLCNTYSYCFQLEEQRRNPHVAGDYNSQLRLFDYFAQQKDSFYVYAMELSFYSYSQNLSIFDVKPKEYYINSFSMGGWAARSKQYESFKKLAGVSSLPHDLIDNDHIYFVSIIRMDMYTAYFYETYGIPVKYEQVNDVSGYKIYRIRTAASPAEMGTVY